MTVFKTIFRFSLLVFSCLLFFSCNSDQSSFSWDEEVAKLTDKDLNAWLKKVSFQNEIAAKGDKKVYFTNAEQVFPFMGKYYGETELLHTYKGKDQPIHEQEIILYKDPKWGDLFLSATLLNNKQEIFKSEMNFETGNVVFEGMDAVMNSYSSNLYETSVVTNNGKDKSALYWANSNDKSYLLAFLQKNRQLVFEVAIPLVKNDTISTLNQLKKVDSELGLNQKQWQVLNSKDVKPLSTKNTFWKNPYVGIYFNDYMLFDVEVFVKNSPFQQMRNPKNGDYEFSYQSPKGLVEFYTSKTSTALTEEEFNKENEGSEMYKNGMYNIFYKEKIEGNNIRGTAKAYGKAKSVIEIYYQFPKDDPEAKTNMHNVLRYLKAKRT